MRCDNCDYCKSGDCYETYWECSLGIEETENKKGQCGCRYNKKTLDKMYQKQLDDLYREESEWYINHCTNLFNGS